MDSSKTIGFGIIGLGVIADFHVKAINELAGCKFIAGFDTYPGKAGAFCAARGARPYSSLESFLADPEIDIVTIATPSGLHLDGAVAAIRAGKHLIVEKPLEITTARCGAIIAEAEARKVKVGTIFPSRYYDSSRLVKQAVAEQRLGKIVLAGAQIKWYRSQEYYDSGEWRGTWKMDGGGALMNQGIHAVDLLQWLIGDVAEVYAYTGILVHERIEVEDAAVAGVRFVNGALGTIEATTGVYPGFPKKIEICGSQGCITLEEEGITTWQFAEERPEDELIRRQYLNPAAGSGASDPAAIGHHGHRMLFESFVNAVREDKTPDIDGHEGKKAVEIIEGIYRSAGEHKPVALPL
jgi:predicted dehydrogenase